MSEVVTGEAVVVEVRVAQLSSRALAFLIDFVLQCTALVGVFLLLAYADPIIDDALAAGLSILLTALVTVGYPVVFETVSRGRSIGKLVMGLRVVGEDGSPERFRQALLRGLAGFVEFWMFAGAPALITSLVNERGKRLGDIFAGTLVIGERAPHQDPPPVMPPQLASWAATLELSQLSDELAGAARQYLSRWHQLAPDVQHEMGVRIAGEVMSRVSPPPPPGVPPYAYLAAVLAERRRRTELRLARARHGAGYGSPAWPETPSGLGVSPTSAPPPAPSPDQDPPPPGPTPGGFVPPA